MSQSDPLTMLANLSAVQDSKREAQRAANRAAFPELAAIMDDVRAKGGTVKLLWAANPQGDRIGPVPADWDAPFGGGA